LDLVQGCGRREPERIERLLLHSARLPPRFRLFPGLRMGCLVKKAKRIAKRRCPAEPCLERRSEGGIRGIDAKVPGRPVAGQSLLLEGGDIVIAHSLEEVVAPVELANMLLAEPDVLRIVGRTVERMVRPGG